MALRKDETGHVIGLTVLAVAIGYVVLWALIVRALRPGLPGPAEAHAQPGLSEGLRELRP